MELETRVRVFEWKEHCVCMLQCMTAWDGVAEGGRRVWMWRNGVSMYFWRDRCVYVWWEK